MGGKETRPDLEHSFSLPRRGVLRASSSGLGLAGSAGTIKGASHLSERLSSTEEAWGRLMSIHPRWYWGEGKTVEESRQAMREWLDMAALTGVNVLHAWIESPGAAALLGEPRYADRYDFWNPDRWDAMGELITEAAERGMEVHLWYSFTRYKRTRNWVPEYDPELTVLPPGDPDWASVRKSEYARGYTDPEDPHVSGDALCNNEFAAHDWTMELLTRLFDRYPSLNGLKIEEPGYLDADRCVCHRCQAVYAGYYDEPGENLLNHIYKTIETYYVDNRAVPVKTRGTNKFARRVYDWWEASGPSDALFYSGSYQARRDRVRGRNWALWSRWGLVPYYIPQTFASSMKVYRRKLRVIMEAVSDSAIIPAIGIKWSYGTNTPERVAAQITATKAFDGESNTTIAGASLFSGAALTSDLARTLRTGPYASEAVSPWQSRDDQTRMQETAIEGELNQLYPFTWTDTLPDRLPGEIHALGELLLALMIGIIGGKRFIAWQQSNSPLDHGSQATDTSTTGARAGTVFSRHEVTDSSDTGMIPQTEMTAIAEGEDDLKVCAWQTDPYAQEAVMSDAPADDTDDMTADEPEPWPGEWEPAVELESISGKKR